jgi:LysR family glycine cleavage system transcriptional activator
MPANLPSLNALRAFEASARQRSFSRAAEELHVTPAAISHQIKGLEAFLGAGLFRRAKGTLMLTEAGQRLLPGVRKGFDAFREAMENFGAYDKTGPLNVTMTPSIAAKWLIPRLEHFNRQHPEIDIRITTTLEMIDYEREGVEIGIRYGRGDYPGLVTELLLSSEVSPVCSPQLLAGEKPLKRPKDLAHFTLLHDESPLHDETHPNWAMWLRAAGATDVDATHGLRFDHASTSLSAAIEGVGVALGRSALVDKDIAAGRLVRPFELRLPSDFGYYVVYPEQNLKRTKVAVFREWLFAEVAADRDPSGSLQSTNASAPNTSTN